MSLAVAFVFAACASKDDVTAVDVEKQAFEDLRAGISDIIDDPARRAEAIGLVGVLEQDLEALRKSIAERKTRARELNANYDTENIDTIWNRYFAVRDNYNRDMLDLRFQLKDQLTRDEWQQVFAE